MPSTFLLGVGLGILAHTMSNVGRAVQKQGVHVLTLGRAALSREHLPAALTWMVGTVMVSTVFLPMTFALKYSGSPSTIASLIGVGLMAMTLYSVLALGERLRGADVLGVLLVVEGATLMGAFGRGAGHIGRHIDIGRLALGELLLLGAAGGLCLLARRWPALHGVAYGALAGVLAGTSLFLGDVALVRSGGSVIDQLANPFPYIALLHGTLATVVTQVALYGGRALQVVPALNAVVMLSPLPLEAIVYGHTPTPAKLLLTVVLLTGVVLLSTNKGVTKAQAPDTTLATEPA